MQILNISVQNRPSKTLTGRPYVFELIGSTSTTAVVDAIMDVSPYRIKEATLTTATLDEIYRRELLVSIKVDPAKVSTSAVLDEIKITKQVAYIQYSVGMDRFQTTAVLDEIVLTQYVKPPTIIKYDIGILKVATTATLDIIERLGD